MQYGVLVVAHDVGLIPERRGHVSEGYCGDEDWSYAPFTLRSVGTGFVTLRLPF